jgi:hypothetical protein
LYVTKANIMRVLVVGQREYAEVTLPRCLGAEAVAEARAVARRQRLVLWTALDELHATDSAGAVTLLLHDGAPGAGACAQAWACDRRIKEKSMKLAGKVALTTRLYHLFEQGQPDMIVIVGHAGLPGVEARARRLPIILIS